MQGKTKGFFEDTGIILVLAASIYGGYYLYDRFSNQTEKSLNNLEFIEKKTLNIIEHKENNDTLQVEKIINIKQPIKKIIEKKEPTIIPTVLKNKTIKEPSTSIEKSAIKKEKNVDIGKLRTFLRNIKFSIASNIVKRDDINSTISQELKIRITVLKDGSYEELIFVGGDKILFNMNKENILKVFPVQIDEKIKDDFPRYVRLSIK